MEDQARRTNNLSKAWEQEWPQLQPSQMQMFTIYLVEALRARSTPTSTSVTTVLHVSARPFVLSASFMENTRATKSRP